MSAVKGIDNEGNLQTVPPPSVGGFMQVDRNSDVFSNFISNFYRKYQDTSGLELFSVKAFEVELHAKAIEDNHRNPTSESDKRADKWKCPDTICNVKVSTEQKAAFEAGQAVKMENLQFKDGTRSSAYL